jgi:hypothetical protein
MPFAQARQIGDHLVAIGKKHEATGTRLVGASDQLRAVAVRLENGQQVEQSLQSIRTGATSIRNLLAPVATALQFIVNALNGITVPTITQQTRVINFPGIGNVTFVTGLTIGSTTPFTATATRVNTILTNVNSIRDTLTTIANGARDIRSELPHVRTAIMRGADDVEQGGKDLSAGAVRMIKAGQLLGGS